MTTYPCPSPEFVWAVKRTNPVWSACVHCGRLAWDHEQADPMADILNARAGRTGPKWPPVMRPAD